MQIYVILIACVVLLLCLFFKVPVFISVFAGALVYFLLGASSSPAILAQRIISGTQSSKSFLSKGFTITGTPKEAPLSAV